MSSRFVFELYRSVTLGMLLNSSEPVSFIFKMGIITVPT